MRVVISQSMYFPWVGLLEQVKLADVFVHYDDVQITRGFYNRVQVKGADVEHWLTVPLQKHPRDTNIDHAMVDNSRSWREEHHRRLVECYGGSPYFKDMIEIVERVFGTTAVSIADISRNSIVELASYFSLGDATAFANSQGIARDARSTSRLLAISKFHGATTYVTGHGARNYLDHEAFEQSGISVEYMNYRMRPYPQQHGAFTPFVSSLDLVANCGRAGAEYICSGSVPWKEFLRGS